jgi:hypothetical protein
MSKPIDTDRPRATRERGERRYRPCDRVPPTPAGEWYRPIDAPDLIACLERACIPSSFDPTQAAIALEYAGVWAPAAQVWVAQQCRRRGVAP